MPKLRLACKYLCCGSLSATAILLAAEELGAKIPPLIAWPLVLGAVIGTIGIFVIPGDDI